MAPQAPAPPCRVDGAQIRLLVPTSAMVPPPRLRAALAAAHGALARGLARGGRIAIRSHHRLGPVGSDRVPDATHGGIQPSGGLHEACRLTSAQLLRLPLPPLRGRGADLRDVDPLLTGLPLDLLLVVPEPLVGLEATDHGLLGVVVAVEDFIDLPEQASNHPDKSFASGLGVVAHQQVLKHSVNKLDLLLRGLLRSEVGKREQHGSVLQSLLPLLLVLRPLPLPSPGLVAQHLARDWLAVEHHLVELLQRPLGHLRRLVEDLPATP
mmetsp:Transcript_6753/g.25385  ORF Transcript_6753/g.25385 Transcript_6753/m.25385 type:complete len:267 (+) Transcript_6753:228-1028(+)